MLACRPQNSDSNNLLSSVQIKMIKKHIFCNDCYVREK